MRAVVACLGDSITEGSPYWDSGRRAGDPQGQWQWVNDDGDHPSIDGYRRLGELAFRFPFSPPSSI
jgi:lysophospholipase L1-like esterase